MAFRPWRPNGSRTTISRSSSHWSHAHVFGRRLLFVGVLLVALGLFVAGNMVIVGVGIVALFGAGAFETLAARRS